MSQSRLPNWGLGSYVIPGTNIAQFKKFKNTLKAKFSSFHTFKYIYCRHAVSDFPLLWAMSVHRLLLHGTEGFITKNVHLVQYLLFIWRGILMREIQIETLWMSAGGKREKAKMTAFKESQDSSSSPRRQPEHNHYIVLIRGVEGFMCHYEEPSHPSAGRRRQERHVHGNLPQVSLC
jgi:hypothetical protein